jgi:hypothetical protein
MMCLDFGDSSPRTAYSKRAEIVAAGQAICSTYSGCPATHVHMVLDVDFEGDRRLMHADLHARDIPAAPLMLVGEQCLVTANAFSGEKVYATKFIPAWANLRQATRPAEGEDWPRVTTKARIVHKVETVSSSHSGYQVSLVHFRVELVDLENQSAFFTLRPDEIADAALVGPGQIVEISFFDCYDEPGRLSVRDLTCDWVAYRQVQLEARKAAAAA